MATEITLTRKARATKIDRLQADDGLWSVLEELEAYLRDQDIRRLTVDDVAAFLIPLHSDATLTKATIEYVWLWDGVFHRFKKVCIFEGTISIPDGPVEDSILASFKVSASYE